MINFWFISRVTDFLKFFSHFFTFLPVTFNLAYFAAINCAAQIFPLNFIYQRCLENSKIINFWLTSWVPLPPLFHFFPVTLNKPTLHP